MKRSKTHFILIKTVVPIILFIIVTACGIKVEDHILQPPSPCDCRTITLYAGIDDNYQFPIEMPDHRVNDPFDLPPPPYPATLYLNYDEQEVNKSLVQTFDWSGIGFGPITCATLEFEAKPLSTDSYNDNIQIYPWYFAENVIGVHPIAGAWLGTDVSRNIQGLQNPSWSQANFGNTLFTIDLENFPSDRYNRTHGGQRDPAYPYGLSRVPYFESINPTTINNPYQMEGGYDLTHMMSKLQHLDVFIGDDTAIDYMKLTLTSCDCEG